MLLPPILYICIRGDNQRIYTGVIISGRKGDTSKIGNSSGIPNLASEIGALCHIFRDIYILSAFPEAALLGTRMGKALKMSISSEIAPYPLVFSPVLL
jgi:hypothetical protein